MSVPVALRVDVDTLRGTRRGVPELIRTLDRHQVRASFFFSVGPDNMGRNLWRMINPAFLKKMVRSGAPSLYGWDILLMGTAWPGPKIGPRCRDAIRAVARAGHEIGVHAWDHFTWQHRLESLSPERIAAESQKAHDMIAEIAAQAPCSAAAPGWKVSDDMLELRDRLGYRYASDCRGGSMFRPVVRGRALRTPQIPATLPTFDELTGAVTPENFNAAVIGLVRPDALNVYTIHAEAEGIAYAGLFDRLLGSFKERGFGAVPLGSLLPPDPAALPEGMIGRGVVSGRADWVSVQVGASQDAGKQKRG